MFQPQHPFGQVRPLHVREDNGEFVAADARREIGAAVRRLQRAGENLDQAIADQVTVRTAMTNTDVTKMVPAMVR